MKVPHLYPAYIHPLLDNKQTDKNKISITGLALEIGMILFS